MTLEEFVRENRHADVSSLALRMRQFPELDAAFALQQIEGWQRTQHKLPQIAARDDWWYPVRVSCEQASSEMTAHYKAQLLSRLSLPNNASMADLTGGFGIDCWYMREVFEKVDYVERDAELCRIAEHNFKDTITVHHGEAETYLKEHPTPSVFYLDPARRDRGGKKVFLLSDCEPDVTSLLPAIPDATVILLKLSPMLDTTAAIAALRGTWETHIVAVHNEVKEVLLLRAPGLTPTVTAIDLPDGQPFTFTRDEEAAAQPSYVREDALVPGQCYLYEPNAALLKAGAYHLIGNRYGLHKLAPNTHLYASSELVSEFLGRIFALRQTGVRTQALKGLRANIITRNYPLSADQLRHAAHLLDGDEAYVIGARVGATPQLFLADRLA